MNITDMLVSRAARTPDLTLYALGNATGFELVSAARFLGEVQQVAKGLIASGVQPS
jgi:long-chain acyl-CoA synthetase